MTFEVQTHTICDGWINIWHETGDDDISRAVTFETREAAEKALAEFITAGKITASLRQVQHDCARSRSATVEST